jgi:hypothetical protein
MTGFGANESSDNVGCPPPAQNFVEYSSEQQETITARNGMAIVGSWNLILSAVLLMNLLDFLPA